MSRIAMPAPWLSYGAKKIAPCTRSQAGHPRTLTRIYGIGNVRIILAGLCPPHRGDAEIASGQTLELSRKKMLVAMTAVALGIAGAVSTAQAGNDKIRRRQRPRRNSNRSAWTKVRWPAERRSFCICSSDNPARSCAWQALPVLLLRGVGAISVAVATRQQKARRTGELMLIKA
jgi:hypothetical protein